jgi:hypothetical protein
MDDSIAAHDVPRLTWDQVFARRLERQWLSASPPGAGPADVARGLCGVHAQVMSAAELSVGLRSAGTTRTDVREELWERHSLVKAYGPRGTVHLLAAQDLPLWTGVLPAVPYAAGGHPEGVRLTPDEADQVVKAIGVALADAELTIDELHEAVVDVAGPWAGELSVEAFQGKWPRWRLGLPLAGMRGVMCFGPGRGRKVTYTNPHRWLPGFTAPAAVDGGAGLAELLRRYLHTYGPATPQQFAQWLAVPPRWATDLFDSQAGELQRVDVEGTAAWVAAGDAAVPSARPGGVRLLPYFDGYAYLTSGRLRERLYPGRAAERVAGNFQVMLIDGAVAGLWHQRRSGRRLDITVEPLDPLTGARRRELDEQVERVGEILEGTPRLTIGTVTVGGHA